VSDWSSWDVREELERLLVRDLLGPWGEDAEELAAGSSPSERYIVGVLYPRRTALSVTDLDDTEGDAPGDEGGSEIAAAALAGSMAPSSLGLSFSVPLEVEKVVVTASWGRYERGPSDYQLKEDGTPRNVWRRTPCVGDRELDLTVPETRHSPDPHAPRVVVRVRARVHAGVRVVDVTLVNEQPEPDSAKDTARLFQCKLSVTALDGAKAIFVPHNDPAHRQEGAKSAAELELAGLELLYRGSQQFAVGRNAAVEVNRREGEDRAWQLATSNVPFFEVGQTVAPNADAVPELAGLQVDMAWLASADRTEVVSSLRPLAEGYRAWIDEQEKRLGHSDIAAHTEAAERHLQQARVTANRVSAGIDLLAADDKAWKAWQFANEAMALQRLHTEVIAARTADASTTLAEAEAAADVPSKRSWRPFQLAFVLLNLPSLTDPSHGERGPAAELEGLVDLLFFPTGGGKTEAYLGLTAYTFAIRRLQGVVGDGAGRDGGTGVAVLMRYTLRLLTAQQFQRAATLVSAAEVMRRRAQDAGDNTWGDEPFRIGLWVGSKVTPNWFQDAEGDLDEFRGKYASSGAGSPVQVLACPWCGRAVRTGQDAEAVADIRRVLVWCGDEDGLCPFSRRQSTRWREGIPVVTVDEEVFRLAPSLVIGTVDKFAQLPLNGWTGMLFGAMSSRCERHGFMHPDLGDRIGCGPGGHQKAARWSAMKPRDVLAPRPPDLVIQDELHLISGALGTMVGLYETAVDRHASWQLNGKTVRPKVVASTATVRRAREQVHGLFDRDLAVFPPPVLDAGQTFFSTQVPVTQEHPGRRYVGVCAHGQRMKYVQIRVAQLLLAAGQLLFDNHGRAADPYMTLVDYFSSTHELAGMRRMVEDDITTRLRSQDRRGLANRGGPELQELTSRVSSDGIGKALQRLGYAFDPDIDTTAAQQQRSGLLKQRREAEAAGQKAEVKRLDGEIEALPGYPLGQQPIDVLLATSMLQVGVDVSRLGLMMVTGQPKNAAEYIQATSRVGRDPGRPGLVVTVYNWARPRDLAHFETFAHFHETFYARVEALSVTPFADRALDRGLTAVLVSALRHSRPDWEVEPGAQLVPISNAEIDDAISWIAERAGNVLGDASAKQDVIAQCRERMDEWDRRRKGLEAGQLSYTAKPTNGGLHPLLVTTPTRWSRWSVGTSLREVEPEANLLLALEAPEVADRPDWQFGAGAGAAEMVPDEPEADIEGALTDEAGVVPDGKAVPGVTAVPPAEGEAAR
jgi:hypothetical protein